MRSQIMDGIAGVSLQLSTRAMRRCNGLSPLLKNNLEKDFLASTM